MFCRGLCVLGACCLLSSSLLALKPEILRSTAAVPAHIAGRFRDAAGFQESSSGQFFVFDRRSHVVFGLDAEQASSWEIVHIGGRSEDTRLNSSHVSISYAVFCLKKKK